MFSWWLHKTNNINSRSSWILYDAYDYSVHISFQFSFLCLLRFFRFFDRVGAIKGDADGDAAGDAAGDADGDTDGDAEDVQNFCWATWSPFKVKE